MFRLHGRDQAQSDGVGLSCDETGVHFGAYPLIEAEPVDGRTLYRVRPAAEIGEVLTCSLGKAFDAGRIRRALDRVAKLLNHGELGNAQVAALQMRLPDLVGREALDRIENAARFVRFNPNHYPKGPRGGQFAPADSGASAQSPSSATKPRTKFDRRPGGPVRLPNGERILDPNSPTGFLMSPVESLADVAAAGRQASVKYGRLISDSAAINPGGEDSASTSGAFGDLIADIGSNVGTGGKFDYQRAGSFISGFIQKPQFRDVSNFNVGLFMQQAGFGPEQTLWISGFFALLASSNRRLDQPYGLDPRTSAWIAEGYRAGASGAFSTQKGH